MMKWLVGAFMNCKLYVLVKALRYEVIVQKNIDDEMVSESLKQIW